MHKSVPAFFSVCPRSNSDSGAYHHPISESRFNVGGKSGHCRRAHLQTTGLAARGESTIGRAHRYCGQDQGARRRRCRDIVDDEQRRDCPQYLCAQRVPAAQGHLLRWRSSTIFPYRLRRAALHLPLRRSERGPLYFHHGLLAFAPDGRNIGKRPIGGFVDVPTGRSVAYFGVTAANKLFCPL